MKKQAGVMVVSRQSLVVVENGREGERRRSDTCIRQPTEFRNSKFWQNLERKGEWNTENPSAHLISGILSPKKGSTIVIVIGIGFLAIITVSKMRFRIASLALSALLTFSSVVDGFVIVPPTHHFASSTSLQAQSSPSALFYESPERNSAGGIQFVSPVLQQVYPSLLKWKQEYGHPNIPLGSTEGRQCATLRRLHIQNKLTDEEVTWLEELGFTFHSMEDVYHDVDFDTLLGRLLEYEAKHPESNFQVPKKCPEDPELGAWVTGIRRLGPEGVDPEHAERLNEIGFAWVSSRKCGSKFMVQYKELVEKAEYMMQAEGMSNEEAVESLVEDPKVKDLIKAQAQVYAKGKMSETRMNYMNKLFGESWTTLVWKIWIDYYSN